MAKIHPTARVSPSAVLGDGVIVRAGARVGIGAEIGDGAVIGVGATVAPWARVAPGSRVPRDAVVSSWWPPRGADDEPRGERALEAVRARTVAGWSQARIARAIGVDQATLSRWLAGLLRPPRGASLEALEELVAGWEAMP